MRRGFSLFELIVALGLSVALMTLIGFAMQFYAESLRQRDNEIERTQVVRSVMDIIASDLRGCLNPPPFDASALEAVLASAAASSTGSDAGGGGRGRGGGDGAAPSDALSDGDESESTDVPPDESLEVEEDLLASASSDLTTGSVTLSRPGMVGNQYQIQFDVSRLPRVEEYIPMLVGSPDGSVIDQPSDIKTVSYYVVGEGILNDELGFDPAQPVQPSGLARRELDRQINQYAVANGNVLGLQQTAQLLAPEISQIEFQYWDGIQWLYEWHSDEYGGLPKAVQVRLTLAPPADEAPAEGVQPEVFEMIVPIPSAAPLETTDDATLLEEETL